MPGTVLRRFPETGAGYQVPRFRNACLKFYRADLGRKPINWMVLKSAAGSHPIAPKYGPSDERANYSGHRRQVSVSEVRIAQFSADRGAYKMIVEFIDLAPSAK